MNKGGTGKGKKHAYKGNYPCDKDDGNSLYGRRRLTLATPDADTEENADEKEKENEEEEQGLFGTYRKCEYLNINTNTNINTDIE